MIDWKSKRDMKPEMQEVRTQKDNVWHPGGYTLHNKQDIVFKAKYLFAIKKKSRSLQSEYSVA